MKTFLSYLALVLAIALPSAVAAAIFGADLPRSFGLDEALGLFVLALTGLTLASDYTQRPAALGAPRSLAPQALATEERRLAA